MFLTDCQACGLRELRGPRAIDLLLNTDHGVELLYRCTRCGASNRLTGRSKGIPPVHLAAPAA
jgi:hypothetical protein